MTQLVSLILFLFNLNLSLNTSMVEQQNWDKVVIIDVRSSSEWQESHLEGAIWIPWVQIEQGMAQHQITPDAQVAFYCAAGVEARRAIQRLKQLGYRHTTNLMSLHHASAVTGRRVVN